MTYSTNILNEELCYSKNPKMCDPILVTPLPKMRPIIKLVPRVRGCPIIVNPIVKMGPHPAAAHPHEPLIPGGVGGRAKALYPLDNRTVMW